MYSQLRKMLETYKSGKRKSYTRGDWEIAEGGYDLWFEIYYNGVAKVQCIDGELIVGNDRDIDAEKVLHIVREVLNYVR